MTYEILMEVVHGRRKRACRGLRPVEQCPDWLMLGLSDLCANYTRMHGRLKINLWSRTTRSALDAAVRVKRRPA